jgi:O-antigen polymerase
MKTITSLIIALLIGTLIQQEYYLFKWYTLDTSERSNKLETYQKLSQKLGHNINFLNYYAQTLIDKGEFLQADSLLNLIAKQNPNHTFFIIWGDTKLMLRDTSVAIDKFLTASYMVPNTVEPKFRLFDIYVQQHDTLNAKIWALKIVNQKIKVPSFYTEGWQREAKKFLSNK